MSWTDGIPVVSGLGAMFVAGGAWFQLRTIQRDLDRLADELRRHAESEGKRVGDLESFRYAVERADKAVRRVRRELAEESRGIPLPTEDEEST